VYFNGEPLNSSHPSQIGYMPEERGLYKQMEVGDHLMYLAQLKGLSKTDAKQAIDHWFEKFGIQDWWNKKVEELSKGMQQKIQFISTEHGNVVKETPGSIIIQLRENESSNDFLNYLLRNNVRIQSFNEILPTLNEIFIRKVGAINVAQS